VSDAPSPVEKGSNGQDTPFARVLDLAVWIKLGRVEHLLKELTDRHRMLTYEEAVLEALSAAESS